MAHTQPDHVLRLHPLTMVPEGDEVMVGRPDVGSYALFPAEGAELLRRLEAGASLREAGAWCERTFGSPIDLDDYLDTLYELEFVDATAAPAAAHDGRVESAGPAGGSRPDPVRFQRLGRALFSPAAWTAYALVVCAAVSWMVEDPALRPSYHQLFFSHYLALIPVVIMVSSMPLIVLHEAYHALAGRRLGLPSTFSIGRRWLYLVAETRMDALYSVPRRQRYLPFLAGMVADVVATAALTLLAGCARALGSPRWLSGLLLALALSCVLRLLWQLLLYLQTDLYFVFTTLLRCPDLHDLTRQLIGDTLRRLRGRPTRSATQPGSREHRMARRFAPVLVGGYLVSLAVFGWVGLPATVHFWAVAAHRIAVHTSVLDTLDGIGVFVVDGIPLLLLGYVTLRDLRARRAARREHHPTSGHLTTSHLTNGDPS